MDYRQIALDALRWLFTTEGMTALLERVLLLAAAGAIVWILTKLFKKVVELGNRAWGRALDLVARQRSTWARKRVRQLLNVYTHDVRLRNSVDEKVTWLGSSLLIIILLLSASVFIAAILPGGTLAGGFLFVITWWMAFGIISKIDRLRNPQGTDEAARARLNKLMSKAGIDDEIRQWWLDTFGEPMT